MLVSVADKYSFAEQVESGRPYTCCLSHFDPFEESAPVTRVLETLRRLLGDTMQRINHLGRLRPAWAWRRAGGGG